MLGVVFVVLQVGVPNKFDIKVKRDSILEDSYRVIMGCKSSDILKTRYIS